MAPGDIWASPPIQPILKHDEVHVWRAILPHVQDRERLSAFLSREERTRADRFRFSVDRERFAVTRGLLRGLLGVYLHVRPDSLVFSSGTNGKPSLTQPECGLTFNVSHSGDLALFAVAGGRAVGVDVERIRPLEVMEISQRFFSVHETDVLARLSAGDLQRAFFGTWTRREAVLKAWGEGIHLLEAITVSPGLVEPAAILDAPPDLHHADWHLVDLEPGPGYIGALAGRGFDWTLRCWDGNFVRFDLA